MTDETNSDLRNRYRDKYKFPCGKADRQRLFQAKDLENALPLYLREIDDEEATND